MAEPINNDAERVTAAFFWTRRAMHASWRSWLAVTLACGLAAGIALAAASDARRTWSALPRSLHDYSAADAYVSADESAIGPEAAAAFLDEVERLPDVVATGPLGGVQLAEVTPDGTIDPRLLTGSALALLPENDAALRDISRLRLLDGRRAAPDQPFEVTVSPEMLTATGWKVGDRVTSLRLFRLDDLDETLEPDPTKGTPLTLDIVGVTYLPEDYLTDPAQRIPRLFLTPAFGAAMPGASFYRNEGIRLRDGAAGIPALRDEVTAIAEHYPGATASVASASDGLDAAQKALRPQVIALWLFVGLLLLTVVLIAGQTIGRQIHVGARDLPVLRAIGMDRSSRWAVGVLQGAVVAAGAALVAVAVAVASSLFTPLGSTHAVEPHPGLSLDLAVLGTGALAVFALLVLASLAPARRAARRAERGIGAAAEIGGQDRPSRLVELLARIGVRPPGVIGARMAMQPGRGRTAVGVRGVTASITLAILMLTFLLGFASDLNRLLDTPALYGWQWDAGIQNLFGPIPDEAVDQLARGEQVSAATGATLGDLKVEGHDVPAVGLDMLAGDVYLPVTSGRPATSDNELVLGDKTLRDIGRHIGDEVTVESLDGIRSMRIVGTATFPALGSTRFRATSLGTGAASTPAVVHQTEPGPDGTYNMVLLRFSPGADRAAATADLRQAVTEAGCSDATCVITDLRPAQLSGYTQVGSVLVTAIAALAVLVLITLVHGLVSTVRARRRDLAVLRVIGFSRGQLRSVLVWESLTFSGAGLLIGIPLGLITATWVWRAFTNSLGFDPGAAIPVGAVTLSILAVLGLAIIVALLCGARLRRLQPATILDVE